MRSHLKIPFLSVAGIALCLFLPGRGVAQRLVTLHEFGFDGGYNPQGNLVVSGKTLYGAAMYGGSSDTYSGVVYSINANGTGYTKLHVFSAYEGQNNTNGDGAQPHDGVVLSGNTLYGTAQIGGAFGDGTVFRLNTDGTGFTVLHTFGGRNNNGTVNVDGAIPYGIVLVGNTLYGITRIGGNSGDGTVFAINTDGTGFTNLHSFSATSGYFSTNSDGATPQGSLVTSRLLFEPGDATSQAIVLTNLFSALYGVTQNGGIGGGGAIFRINTDGSGFTNLHSFSTVIQQANSDGFGPRAGLILSNGVLYGTTENGGTGASGVVFSVNTDGTGFATLHSFTRTSDYGFNSDGRAPLASVALFGKTLYGTAHVGGKTGGGTVFAVNTDGSGFKVLFNFTDLVNGANPWAGLVKLGNELYGTTTGWAKRQSDDGYGTLFSLRISPPLKMNVSGNNVVLTWPTMDGEFDFTGFTLQTTTDPQSVNSWTTVPITPTVVNGEYMVTNANTSSHTFYRLMQ